MMKLQDAKDIIGKMLATQRSLLFSQREALNVALQALGIVESVANMDDMPENSDGWQECVFRCGAGELGKYHHATDCPYTLARQLAGSEGNGND